MQNTVFLLYLHSGYTYSNKGGRGEMHRRLRPVGNEKIRKKCSACVSRCVTVRSGTVQNEACPVKGRAKRQLYKNQGGLSDWLTQQHSVSRWYCLIVFLFIHFILLLQDLLCWLHFYYIKKEKNVNHTFKITDWLLWQKLYNKSDSLWRLIWKTRMIF